jgi:hypothetical protein
VPRGHSNRRSGRQHKFRMINPLHTLSTGIPISIPLLPSFTNYSVLLTISSVKLQNLTHSSLDMMYGRHILRHVLSHDEKPSSCTSSKQRHNFHALAYSEEEYNRRLHVRVLATPHLQYLSSCPPILFLDYCNVRSRRHCCTTSFRQYLILVADVNSLCHT